MNDEFDFVDDPDDSGLDLVKQRTREALGDLLVGYAKEVQRTGLRPYYLNRLASLATVVQHVQQQLDIPEPAAPTRTFGADAATRETEGVQAVRGLLTTMSTATRPKQLNQLLDMRNHFSALAKERELTEAEKNTVARLDVQICEAADSVMTLPAELDDRVENTVQQFGKLLREQEAMANTLPALLPPFPGVES